MQHSVSKKRVHFRDMKELIKQTETVPQVPGVSHAYFQQHPIKRIRDVYNEALKDFSKKKNETSPKQKITELSKDKKLKENIIKQNKTYTNVQKQKNLRTSTSTTCSSDSHTSNDVESSQVMNDEQEVTKKNHLSGKQPIHCPIVHELLCFNKSSFITFY